MILNSKPYLFKSYGKVLDIQGIRDCQLCNIYDQALYVCNSPCSQKPYKGESVQSQHRRHVGGLPLVIHPVWLGNGVT